MPGEKPVEASLGWKPSVHKFRDRGSNPGLIGAKRGKIHCANLLPLILKRLHFINTEQRDTLGELKQLHIPNFYNNWQHSVSDGIIWRY